MRSSPNKHWEDPIVAELHAVRERMMAEYNHDFRAFMADMMRRQALSGRKLVKAQPGRPRAVRSLGKKRAVVAGGAARKPAK